jgi:chemotaxis methyl-accepting protein methylase
MNTARNIRIATGMKKIELGNENMAILQISDVLRQHRESLIHRLLSDLSTYINYKFSAPPKKEQLQLIRNKLLDLKNSNINVARYSALINEVLENETTYVRSEPFYHEINEVIGEELNPSQLILVK